MSRKIHLLLCRLKFFSQLEMPLSVLFSELFEKARVKVRITAYLEQFYGEAKNSRTIMYAKIFCPPRNHSIYTVLQTFGKSSYNGQLIQILRTEKMLTYYYVRSAFFFLKSYIIRQSCISSWACSGGMSFNDGRPTNAPISTPPLT